MKKTAGDKSEFGRAFQDAHTMDGVDPSVAKLLSHAGLDDGDASDDKVSVTKGSWAASNLKPSQTTMVLSKAVGMALGMLKTGKVGGDLGALVSSDKHILDGHHRWAATILASGKKGKVGGYKANLKGDKLLRVLNLVSKGLFNVRNGNPGSGSLSDFTAGNVAKVVQDFSDKGIPGEYGIPADKVQAILTDAFGSVEKGVEAMASNAKHISHDVPSWAPDRKQMPVINPEQVPEAAKALSKGIVDWNSPHKQAMIQRLASRFLSASSHVGVFISLPEHLSDQFPGLGMDDTSPAHVTFLSCGDVPDSRRGEFLAICQRAVGGLRGPVRGVLDGSVSSFPQPSEGQTVFYSPVRFSHDLAAVRWELRSNLVDAGFSVSDVSPLVYHPHATLAYVPGLAPQWNGDRPRGSWEFDQMEVWGLGEVEYLTLGSAVPRPGWSPVAYPDEPGVGTADAQRRSMFAQRRAALRRR